MCAWFINEIIWHNSLALLRHQIFSEWSHEPAHWHNQPEKEFWKYLSCFVLFRFVSSESCNKCTDLKTQKKYVSKCKPTWTLYLSVHQFSLRVSGRIVFPSVQNINKKVEESQKRTTKLSSFCKEWIQFAQKKTLQLRDTHTNIQHCVGMRTKCLPHTHTCVRLCVCVRALYLEGTKKGHTYKISPWEL